MHVSVHVCKYMHVSACVNVEVCCVTSHNLFQLHVEK